MQVKDDSGQTYWLNKNTLQKQVEHPGVKIFAINKKVLKHKAEEELQIQFSGIHDRKHAILEALLGLKHKVISEVSSKRIDQVYKDNAKKETPNA